MKLRLTSPEYKDYTGQFGIFDFVDGLSVLDVSVVEARRMATVIACETEDGQNPLDPTAIWESVADLPVFIDPAVTTLVTVADELAKEGVAFAQPAQTPQEPTVAMTREQLEAVADKDGIAGLRLIADPLGVKGTSISKLIEEILAKTQPAVPAAFIADGETPVKTPEAAQ